MAKVEPYILNWNNHPQKRDNDETLHNLIVDTFNKNKKVVNMLCFPALWSFEKALIPKLKPSVTMEFEGLEQDKIFFSKALEETMAISQQNYKHKYQLVNKSAFRYLQNTDKKFNIIYFDWLGTWKKETKKEINLVFSRDLFKPKQDKLLIMNLGLNQGAGEDDIYMQELESNIDKGYINFPFEIHYDGKITPNFKRRTYGFANTIAGIAKEYDYELYLNKFNMYKTNGEDHQNWRMSFAFEVS